MVSKKAPNSIDRIIGQNVRRMRMLKGVSQEKLGDALQLTFQQIQKYEKGMNRIGGSRATQIATALGCSINDLFAGTSNLAAVDMPEGLLNDPIRRLGETRRGLDLARNFVRLGERTQNKLADLCEELAAGA